MTKVRNPRVLWTIPLVIAVCLADLPAQAKYGGSETIASAGTNTYSFLPDQSTVVQTGGIAGVHWTYSVEGQFQLTVDPDAGTASFARVDANATDDSPLRRSLNPNEVFNMTLLVGTVLDDTTISFTGKATDGSDVLITLTIQDDLAYLVGETVPPPNSADFFLFSLDAVAQRKYGGGSGTAEDPHHIWTAEQMNTIGAEPNDWGKHFRLMADIDLGGFTGTSFNIIGYYVDWYHPDNKPFTGVFDGDDHKISNFTWSSVGPDDIGLFEYVGRDGRIENLSLENVNIDAGNAGNVGGLVGFNEGTIINCYCTGSVSAAVFVGGLVGLNEGTITKCYSTTSILASAHVGGLVGENSQGTITDSYSTGSVSGDRLVGGLVGYSYRGTITECYSTGGVSGKEFVGGLMGYNDYGAIINCYAKGGVLGNGYYVDVGGLVGKNVFGRITNCYSTGSVEAAPGPIGGLVGDNYYGTVTASYWDIDTSGQATSAGGTGKTTAEMQMESTLTDAGWDFVGENVNGTEDIWCICEGVDYPRLTWEFVIGDFDGDADTDFADFCILAEHWLAADGSFWCGQGCDLTNDGRVDFNDLRYLGENWLARK